jgi:lipopolysaccharide/colanic/teichoic acid biosynthesis glycosyltransferase
VYERVKRAIDVGVTLLAMPLALPLMAACALLIWFDGGRPIVFSQLRTGRGGRRFVLHKFRTMVPNAEALKASILEANQQSGPDFKIANDPRVTRIGGWLRRTSLDELPQLFDVLRGDMSLVGPRPTSFDASTYDLWHTERLEVTPGLTGLWQVTGRADIDFDERVRLDIEYIERRGILFDVGIMFQTLRALVDHKGAY